MPAPPILRPTPGPPLGAGETRRRPVGRIAASTHLPPGDLVADYDTCVLDGRPVDSLDAWRSVIAAGRLAAVEGAFALAWRDPAGTLHLARDGVGERTLFYAQLPDGLAFATSLGDLFRVPGVPRRLHYPAVAAYLSYAYLPGRETLAAGVFEVLPGEHVTWRDGHLFRTPFWELPAGDPYPGDEGDLTAELRRRLETAVLRRLPPGEAVGATLSGGVDSSLVVALAKRLSREPVFTYSVSFGPAYPNELAFSALVAGHCGTDHRVVELSPPTVLHYLDDSVGFLSDPIGDPLTVPNALLFREAAQQVGVVLNGEGGDPTFGGPKNLPMLLAELQPALGGNASREANYLRAHLKCYDDLPDMLTDDVRSALAAAPLEASLGPLLGDPRWPDFVARLQAINIRLKGGHHILPKVDALSAPFGVLPRAPLFDRAVVELSVGIPPRLKLHGSTEKYVLKRAVADLLPAAILDRPKSGMLVPVEGWFRGPLLPAAKARVLDGLAPYGLFRRDYLERLLAGKLGGLRPRHGAKVWLLVTLEAWLRRVFRSPLAA